ncbi:MAG: hypothetical protein WDN28_23395 [Chthoniobacter sp.]
MSDPSSPGGPTVSSCVNPCSTNPAGKLCLTSGGGDSPDPDYSTAPIRYGNGEIKLIVNDIVFYGFGRPWGQARSYDNIFNQNYDGINGINWYVEQNPYLTAVGGGTTPPTLILTTSPTSALWFERLGETNNYVASFTQDSFIVYDPAGNQFIFTDGLGRQILFFDFSIPNTPGQFKGLIDANGNVTSATYDAQDRFISLVRTLNEQETGFYYTYNPGQNLPGKLDVVTLRVNGQDVLRSRYTYYGTGEAEGLQWDLKTAVVEEYNSSTTSWDSLRSSHYRYYTTTNAVGFQHGLKYVVGPEAYQRMTANGLTPETATDAQISAYADHFFSYDWQRRVTQEVTKGGAYTFTFSYSYNQSPASGMNAWVTKTVELLPNGTQNIVYANSHAQALFKIHRQETDEWFDYYQVDDSGNRILTATSSAVAGYDETTPSVGILSPTNGLIKLYQFYGPSDPGGQPEGYLQYEKVQQGSAGTPVLLKEYIYVARTVGFDSIYFLQQEITYQSASGDLAPSVKQLSYDAWYDSPDFGPTFQLQQKTTTLPTITTDQNGSGTANAFTEVFDIYGRRTWLKDPRGFLTAFVPDVVTGALSQRIDDVNTSILPAPNGWITPAGGGLHLINDFQFDNLGRRTQSLGPVHQVDLNGISTSIRRAEWIVYRDDIQQKWEGGGYATGAAPAYTYTLINPVSITVQDRSGRVTDLIQATRGTTTGPLAATDTFPQTSWTRWSRSAYDNRGLLAWERLYFSIPMNGIGSADINYNETNYSYDSLGRIVRQQTPGGTITTNVLNAMGWISETWKGDERQWSHPNRPVRGGGQRKRYG